MAKRSERKLAVQENTSPGASAEKSIFQILLSSVGLPLLLAAAVFLVYWPSLKSDFVYDARLEIFKEGFITSISNLPAVLSLKVLGMKLMLGDRPGQLLYLMLNAAVWGKEPWGYHLSSNLLHAANVALLFVFLRRLIATEVRDLTGTYALKAQLATVAVTLIFAVHPITVEPVSGISYSSDLLVTLFTLLALLAATAFRSDNFRIAVVTGSVGTFCAFAAVICKESGLATALLLIVYWFLFRRREAKGPWLLFLGAATVVTAVFLTARFLFAPPPPSQNLLHYLGGSFFHVFLIQPRIWVFMMDKLLWPAHLSADYTLENMSGLTTPLALALLVVVVALQVWLAFRSQTGALGVAIYWLGLVTVSNFTPLNRILADRFYYLPLTGVVMQLLALLLMTLRSRSGFWMGAALLLGALLSLSLLSLTREKVFASDFQLWTDTIQVSPSSFTAHNNLGNALLQNGQVDGAMIQYQKALEINPDYAEASNDLGWALSLRGQLDEAITHYQKALEIKPNYADARNNLGIALCRMEQLDDGIIQFHKALEINPNSAETHNNLGLALLQKGEVDEARKEFKTALQINPGYEKARKNLAR